MGRSLTLAYRPARVHTFIWLATFPGWGVPLVASQVSSWVFALKDGSSARDLLVECIAVENLINYS